MPINKKYPLHELLKILGEYPLKPPSKINLIPFNPWEGCEFKKPEEYEILKFQEILASKGYSVFIRKSKGKDILAACGQLKALYR
jgi:23S rRNA (adenine2503-C2)-methyltransferase